METLATTPEIEFYSAGDGRRLAVRVWRCDEALARVVFLHGITSHGGWYDQVARRLLAAGLEVYFLDRRGSGLNANEPGDVDDWRSWIDDVATYLRGFKECAQDASVSRLPTVLAGISWGGKLAPAVARRHAALVDSVVLICPGLYSPYLPGPLKRFALAMPTPARLQSRRVRIPLRRAELFTNSPHWQAYIACDPLSLRAVTWRFAQEDRRLTRFARESAPFLHMPLLIMLAGQDRIVDNRRTRRFFARMAGHYKTLIEYPDAAHTLEFERDPSQYFADLTDWILRTGENLSVG
jgi:alpha-beta hydrolase superfamily lysophospholipase